MNTQNFSANWGNYLLKIGFFAGIYFITTQFGLLLPFEGELATLLWPASGITLAILLLYGLELLPGIALGALLVAIYNQHSLPLIISITLTHTLEAFVAAYSLKYIRDFHPQLKNFEDVANFLIFGIILSPAIGGLLGVFSFFISPEGLNTDFASLWWHWWIAHAISIAVITPVILTWVSPTDKNLWEQNLVEYLVALGLLTFVSTLIFIRFDVILNKNYPLGHVTFPFLLWIALRFTPREVATAGFISAAMATIGTINKTGPFSSPDLDVNLILLGTFVFSVILMSLMLSSVFAQRREATQALKMSHELLEQRVKERTDALNIANEQLKTDIEERKQMSMEVEKARDEAIQALKIKDQILANVSHDARTPLNIIILYTDMLQRLHTDMDAKIHEKLEIIQTSATELLGFFNNLLAAAKMQSTNMTPIYQPTNIRNLCEQIAKSFRPFATHKKLNFQVNIDENLPSVLYLDIDWLKQIISNLLTNSIKFTEKGSVSLFVQLLNDEQWSLKVSDTGAGITEEDIEKIFDPFWQVDSSSTRNANRGVGLGLSIVQHLVKQLGGHITVESKLDTCSSFIITLPLIQELEDDRN